MLGAELVGLLVTVVLGAVAVVAWLAVVAVALFFGLVSAVVGLASGLKRDRRATPNE